VLSLGFLKETGMMRLALRRVGVCVHFRLALAVRSTAAGAQGRLASGARKNPGQFPHNPSGWITRDRRVLNISILKIGAAETRPE
jgi:hypothetical protein